MRRFVDYPARLFLCAVLCVTVTLARPANPVLAQPAVPECEDQVRSNGILTQLIRECETKLNACQAPPGQCIPPGTSGLSTSNQDAELRAVIDSVNQELARLRMPD
jgi:hypothetical protein